MIHALITIAIQAAIGHLTGNWLVGGLFAAGFYTGREHAQAEYRWIERFGGGRRANMPWWGGFDRRVWNAKSVSDFALPIVFAVLIERAADGLR